MLKYENKPRISKLKIDILNESLVEPQQNNLAQVNFILIKAAGILDQLPHYLALSLSLSTQTCTHKELLLQKHQQQQFKGFRKDPCYHANDDHVQRAWGKASKIGKTYAGFWDNKACTSFQTNTC